MRINFISTKVSLSHACKSMLKCFDNDLQTSDSIIGELREIINRLQHLTSFQWSPSLTSRTVDG